MVEPSATTPKRSGWPAGGGESHSRPPVASSTATMHSVLVAVSYSVPYAVPPTATERRPACADQTGAVASVASSPRPACPGLAGSFRERAGTHRRRGGADLEGGRLGPAAGDAATRQKSDGGNCEGRVDSHRTKSTRQLAPDSRFSRAGADRGETAQQSSGARGREEPRSGP